MSQEVTRTLAHFASQCEWGAIPPETQRATLRTLVNALALGIGAARHPAVERAIATLEPLASPQSAAVLGRHERLGVTFAPLVNGLAMHVEDFDDTHLPTVVHPGAPIVPAVLATAELRGCRGQDALAGLAAGAEVALRVAVGMCPEHFDRGWHVTGTAGHIGAAAAAARVLGLDAEATHRAIGLGATQAAGLTAALGTMTKPFHPGKAAADGVEAALLAEAGFTGPELPIEGRRGFARLASSKVNELAMLRQLGERWELDQNAIKPYACGIVSHAAIDAAVEIRAQLDDADITEIEVTVNPVVLGVMGVRDPLDGLQSKFSVYHCVTVGLMDGDGGVQAFSDERARAPEVVSMRHRVTATVDNGVPKGAAKLAVRTAGGRTFTAEVSHATGSVERPMTEDQLRRKVAGLVTARLGPGGSERVFASCEQLAGAATIGDLVTATSPVVG